MILVCGEALFDVFMEGGENPGNFQMNAESVSTKYLVRTGRRTTVVIVSVSASGQPHYAFYGVGSADCGVTGEDLLLIGDDVIGIQFGSYSLAVKPVADAFAHLMENTGDRFISVDPNIRPTIEPDMQIWRDRLRQYASGLT
ncbi:MAG: hypothetical protein GY820_34815 [Gammaproteobacteria bacterium]|nr:hypothetical protein [Gammaproteobacteria bacterium]